MSEMMDDPFAVTVDEDDPFATGEDFKSTGGAWNPRPSSAEDLAEKLIVVVPRTFEKDAKVSDYLREKFNLPETREQWTADIVVLENNVSGPWKFTYRGKENRDSTEYVEKLAEVTEFPYEMPGYRITWANVIGALNKISNGPKPMGIGRIRAGYTAKEMRSGKTFEDFAAEVAAWEEKVRTEGVRKAGDAPRPRWHFEPSDAAEDRAKALAWWKVARANGFTI